MAEPLNRRGFLRGTLIAGATVGFVSPEERRLAAALSMEPTGQMQKTSPAMPMGKIGDVELSRLISGGNLISGWCHQRDLLFVAKLAEQYLTEKKKFDTLELLEERGVNAMVLDMIQLDITNKYKTERGGEIKTIVAVRQDWGNWSRPDYNELKQMIDQSIDQGADMLFLHGGYCDRLVQADKPENLAVLAQALAYIKDKGVTAGLGSHSIYVPMAMDTMRVEPDFYFKTFHHDRYWSATPRDRRKPFCVDGELHLDHNEFHDNIFCIEPEKTAAYMQQKKQPWIAFKTLAAGAIDPESAWTYCFENGVDFVAAGMFDFEVAEDALIAQRVVSRVKQGKTRSRPWKG